MTKLSTTSEAGLSPKTGRTKKTKASLPHDKWNPNKPFHVTQEEFWEHIHEIERGPFIPVEECFNNIRTWLKTTKGIDL